VPFAAPLVIAEQIVFLGFVNSSWLFGNRWASPAEDSSVVERRELSVQFSELLIDRVKCLFEHPAVLRGACAMEVVESPGAGQLESTTTLSSRALLRSHGRANDRPLRSLILLCFD
jgi:hypothetical protein